MHIFSQQEKKYLLLIRKKLLSPRSKPNISAYLLVLLCNPSILILNASNRCINWFIVFCDLWILSSFKLGTVAEPKSKWSLANFSCCSLIFVICSMVQPLLKARNLPEWKSANRPNRAVSICLTSGTWDIKEWCRVSDELGGSILAIRWTAK